MGMDVYGKNPTTEAGGYFRNNVWWWRPLAEYACAIAPTLTRKCKYWQSNDGAGLNAKDSIALAAKLREEIATGRAKQYSDDRAAKTAAIPRRPCPYCDAIGVRTDSVGIDNGFDQRVIDSPGHPRHGQKGWCNGCDGLGTKESSEAMYPFSVENVEEFARFLEGCGGFKIC